MAVEKTRTVASGSTAEKAVLVVVDLGARSRNSRGGALGARTGVVCSGSADITNLDLDESEIPPESADLAREGDRVHAPESPSLNSPGLDADESLAEFRELVASAGGVVVAELIQHRSRPDPATLIGAGKVRARVTDRRSAKRTRTVTVRQGRSLARSRLAMRSARCCRTGRKTRSVAGWRPSAD